LSGLNITPAICDRKVDANIRHPTDMLTSKISIADLNPYRIYTGPNLALNSLSHVLNG
jgi:hypothetical protein